jgi:hypothetical protein
MAVGDIVTWPLFLGTDWEVTHMQGLIVSSRLVKDYEAALYEVIVYNVLLTDGTLCDVPENENGLELLA